MTDKPVLVEQVDRDAAAALADKLGAAIFLGGNDLAAILNGTWDDDEESGDVLGYLVPAFARHRQPLAARVAELEAGLRFYADRKGYDISGPSKYFPLSEDEGNVARALLGDTK